MIIVQKYKSEFKTIWDSFILTCKNYSFLFFRDFLEYHSDRFEDYSLMIYKENRLIALLPANFSDQKIYSHQGLSYGGFLVLDELKLSEIIDVVKEVLIFLHLEGIKSLIIKNLPRIYHTRTSDEIDWIIFKLDGKIIRRDIALVINNRISQLSYQNRRKRAINKASKLDIIIREGINEFKPFWNEILTPNLMNKYGVLPVHTFNEIFSLASKFPNNIKQHNIYFKEEIVAGCTMFLNENVAHVQYISSSKIGRNEGCLDYLFDFLIKKIYNEFTFFDFGICNEDDGKSINQGLLDWKEGFGARTVIHDFFELKTENYTYLENI